MTANRQVDEPSPTIVGPRPAEGSGGRVSVPQGLERLLTLAGISLEWREKVLADPLAAAAEAGVELSASETAILKATPAGALEQMCDSFARRHGRPVLRKAAAGVAAAALLATSLTGCGDDPPPPVKGIRPDVPRPGAAAPEAPPIQWMDSLDAALAEAKRANRAVMAVFPHPKPGERVPKEYPPSKGLTADIPQPAAEEKSQRVVLADTPEIRKAMRTNRLIAVRITMPSTPPQGRSEDQSYGQAMERWIEAQRKCGILGTWEQEERRLGDRLKKRLPVEEAQQRLPAVVFLAPDGTVLTKLLQPQEEPALIAAIKDVPPLLAKWIAEQRRHEPPPQPTAGTRPPEYPPR